MKARMIAVLMALLGLFLMPSAQAYYNASAGRWLNRDPEEEKGGLNLTCFVMNKPTISYDYLGLNPNIAPGTRLGLDLDQGGKTTLTVGNHFTAEEKALATKALCLLRKLIGNVHTPPWSEMYWATMTDSKTKQLNECINGATYDGSVFINQSKRPSKPCWLGALVQLASTLAHEADHFYTGSTDAPGGPGDRIDTAAQNALAKALRTQLCGCCNHQWHYWNLLEKYACECGVRPCAAQECPQ